MQMPDSNLTVFSSYRDCDEALRHPSSSVDRLKSTMAKRMFAEGATARPQGPPMFLFLDPPDHTRLRKLVSKAFVPKVVNELTPHITELVDGLLDRVAERGRFDAVSDLAYPLPVTVICRLLGVPLQDEAEFSRASALLAQALDPFFMVTGQPAGGMDERIRAGQWLRGYLHDLIAQRRVQPGDDLMSRLIAVEESGDQLAEDEIVSTCMPVADRRPRDHREPDLQRNAGNAARPVAVDGSGSRRRTCVGGRRGNAALRPAGAIGGPNCR